jgi:hypothetical protein
MQTYLALPQSAKYEFASNYSNNVFEQIYRDDWRDQARIKRRKLLLSPLLSLSYFRRHVKAIDRRTAIQL